jgi:hypothetical protein
MKSRLMGFVYVLQMLDRDLDAGECQQQEVPVGQELTSGSVLSVLHRFAPPLESTPVDRKARLCHDPAWT